MITLKIRHRLLPRMHETQHQRAEPGAEADATQLIVSRCFQHHMGTLRNSTQLLARSLKKQQRDEHLRSVRWFHWHNCVIVHYHRITSQVCCAVGVCVL
jgi:hypothetical protein